MNNLFAGKQAESQRGAMSIKSVIILVVVAACIFSAIKVVPVYIEQRTVIDEVDELSRKAAMNIAAYNPDKINTALQIVQRDHELPDGSLTLDSIGDNSAQIAVKYTRKIDLLITTYAWNVDYVSVGKGI
jgi:hypothetical protein